MLNISLTIPDAEGWLLPDVSIVEALESGLAALQAEIEGGAGDSLFRRIFSNVRDDRREAILSWFSRTTLHIVQNYPRVEQEFPCYVVSLEGEDEEQYVGAINGRAILDDGVRGTLRAERWISFVNVTAYAEHPEIVVWMHHLAKWLIASSRCALSEMYTHVVGMAGRDFEPVHVGGETGRLVFRRGLQIRLEYDVYDAHRDSVFGEDAGVCEVEPDGDPRNDLPPCCPPSSQVRCESTIIHGEIGVLTQGAYRIRGN